MKIIAAIFQLERRGGKERDCIAIGRALAARGHDVTLLTTASGDIADVGPRQIVLPRRGLSNQARARAFAADVAAYRAGLACDALLAFERIPGCDYFYAADLPTPSAPWWKLSMARQRTRMMLERGVFDAATPPCVFFLTERQRDAYCAAHRFDPANGVVMPPVLHEDRFVAARNMADRTDTRAAQGWPRQSVVALSVATQSHLKGIDRTLQALASFPDLHLVVVGARRGWRERLGGHGDRVRWLPYAADVIDLMGAADLLIHPARMEAAGQVLVESLLAATPVIASAACGYAGEVSRSGAGIVVPEPYRPAALVDAIREVTAHLPHYRAKAADAARMLQQTRGRWLDVVADTIERRRTV